MLPPSSMLLFIYLEKMFNSEISYETTLTSDNSTSKLALALANMVIYFLQKTRWGICFIAPNSKIGGTMEENSELFQQIRQNIFEFQIGNEFNVEEVKDLIEKGSMEKRKNKQGLSILKIVIWFV